ncbi:MAG: hypothetical protein ACOVVK_24380 [Elsteraceae bacterium]
MSGSPHFCEALLAEAEAAIAVAREAALTAARLHARAELARHMRATADKVRDRPRAEAVAFVVDEWMKAWGLDQTAYPSLTEEMRRFTAAFCADEGLKQAMADLDAAFHAAGLDLGDQMAWRSTCAHRWWLMVNPAPAGAPAQPAVPAHDSARAIWESGCAAKCR